MRENPKANSVIFSLLLFLKIIEENKRKGREKVFCTISI